MMQTINRRQALAGAGAAFLGASAGPTSAGAQVKRFDNETLSTQFWAGPEGQTIRDGAVAPFMTATGAKITVTAGHTTLSLAKMRAEKARPTTSVFLLDEVGVITANRDGLLEKLDLSRMPNAAGESPLGDIIADAQLAATSAEEKGGAVIAFTNPGGVRAEIARREDGAVTYGDLFASQPFRNQLVTITLTGKQIKDMLEQQWLDPKRPRILQVSRGFSYAWDATRPDGERVLPERMSLNGQPVDPAASYRVTVNNFLFVGGDGFTVLTQGTAPQVGIYDVDALHAYFGANSPVGPTAADRIVRVN